MLKIQEINTNANQYQFRILDINNHDTYEGPIRIHTLQISLIRDHSHITSSPKEGGVCKYPQFITGRDLQIIPVDYGERVCQ